MLILMQECVLSTLSLVLKTEWWWLLLGPWTVHFQVTGDKKMEHSPVNMAFGFLEFGSRKVWTGSLCASNTWLSQEQLLSEPVDFLKLIILY